jgi:hypothetical protein
MAPFRVPPSSRTPAEEGHGRNMTPFHRPPERLPRRGTGGTWPPSPVLLSGYRGGPQAEHGPLPFSSRAPSEEGRWRNMAPFPFPPERRPGRAAGGTWPPSPYSRTPVLPSPRTPVLPYSRTTTVEGLSQNMAPFPVPSSFRASAEEGRWRNMAPFPRPPDSCPRPIRHWHPAPEPVPAPHALRQPQPCAALNSPARRPSGRPGAPPPGRLLVSCPPPSAPPAAPAPMPPSVLLSAALGSPAPPPSGRPPPPSSPCRARHPGNPLLDF